MRVVIDLKKKYGIVETKGIQVVDYKIPLQNGISSRWFCRKHGTNLRAVLVMVDTAAASNHTDGNKPFVITLERENINSGTLIYKVNSLSTGFEENNSGVQTAGPDIIQILQLLMLHQHLWTHTMFMQQKTQEEMMLDCTWNEILQNSIWVMLLNIPE